VYRIVSVLIAALVMMTVMFLFMKRDTPPLTAEDCFATLSHPKKVSDIASGCIRIAEEGAAKNDTRLMALGGLYSDHAMGDFEKAKYFYLKAMKAGDRGSEKDFLFLFANSPEPHCNDLSAIIASMEDETPAQKFTKAEWEEVRADRCSQ